MLRILFERARAVFRSRELFQNWLSASIRYVIINPRVLYRRLPNLMGALGKDCINVNCKSGGKVCIDPALYGLIIRHYDQGFIHDIRCDETHNALIINGLMIKLKYNGDYFDLGSAKFKRMYSTIIQVFIEQDYSFVNVSGRVVVDVGAFIGDSAIYFVLRGARRVFAVEPHPGAYAEMLENIKLNNMEDRIIPINAALGSNPGKTRISRSIDTSNTEGVYYGLGINGDIEVPMITLSQLIRDYDIKPDVLKMDCEGCEFDIILNDYEHVRLFKELIFEYHEGNDRRLTDLLNKLSNDYRCDYKYNEGPVGIVHCVKLNL